MIVPKGYYSSGSLERRLGRSSDQTQRNYARAKEALLEPTTQKLARAKESSVERRTHTLSNIASISKHHNVGLVIWYLHIIIVLTSLLFGAKLTASVTVVKFPLPSAATVSTWLGSYASPELCKMRRSFPETPHCGKPKPMRRRRRLLWAFNAAGLKLEGEPEPERIADVLVSGDYGVHQGRQDTVIWWRSLQSWTARLCFSMLLEGPSWENRLDSFPASDKATDLIEERWESREVVVVEEKEEELRAHVVEKKSRESKKKSSKNEFRMEEAMREGGEVTVKLGSQDMDFADYYGGRAAQSARGRSKMQNCMSVVARSSQGILARARACSLEPRNARSSQGLRPYKNLKECIPHSSQGSVVRAKALVEIMKNTLLARASKASLEQASESGFLKEFVFFPI
ncbi:hypothetical protein HYC85_011396 [Camellia sinensis]|uniref:Uncharacterized protein n=1 Tax=Camellia sinensis TaxID=4442 RepID=A0A7J7H8X4_CAMSI|nr:hypothetical protein HYC85_011396 [Camellia sinensis]